MPRLAGSVVWCLLLGLAACSSGGNGDAASTTASTPTSAPAGSTSTSPPTTSTTATSDPMAGADTSAEDGPPQGRGTALLTDVRTGAHPGYDRVVFQFRGPNVPGFHVRYVDPPITEDPSDRPVQVTGDDFLQVKMDPASGADLGGIQIVITYHGPSHVPGPGTGPVREVVRAGDFENVMTWVIGVDHHDPFRVRSLPGPFQGHGRLVVDVS